jgi:hypothetical protein
MFHCLLWPEESTVIIATMFYTLAWVRDYVRHALPHQACNLWPLGPGAGLSQQKRPRLEGSHLATWVWVPELSSDRGSKFFMILLLCLECSTFRKPIPVPVHILSLGQSWVSCVCSFLTTFVLVATSLPQLGLGISWVLIRTVQPQGFPDLPNHSKHLVPMSWWFLCSLQSE